MLVYQDGGVIAPGESSSLDTWYGSGAPVPPDPRQALLDAIHWLQTAINRYQQGCIDCHQPGRLATRERNCRRNEPARTTLKIWARICSPETSPKLSANSRQTRSAISADWLTNNLVPDLLVKLDEAQLKSIVTGMVNDWFDGPNAIQPDWSNAQISAYISNYFHGTDCLGTILTDTAALGAQISAKIPATLPADFPAQEIAQGLMSLANSIESLVPQTGGADEGEVSWALPGTSPLSSMGNLAPALFGVSSYAGQDLQTAALLVEAEGSVDDVCRLATSAWTAGGGLVKVASTVTVAGALPGESLYWGGTGEFDTAGTATSVLNVLATPYGFFKQYQGAATLDSDLLLAHDFFSAIADQLTLLTNGPQAYSSNLTVAGVSVPNVTSGWQSGVADATATVTVDNGDPSLAGVARAVLDVYALDNGQYDNLVVRASSDADLTIPSSQSGTFHFSFQVPSGSLLSATQYLARFTIVSSAGVLISDAMFTASQPSANSFSDIWRTDRCRPARRRADQQRSVPSVLGRRLRGIRARLSRQRHGPPRY